jgi:hypothetical protein
MDIASIALQGVVAADTQLQDAAVQIASYGRNIPQGANVDTVDLSAAVIALLSARTQAAASIDVLKSADQIQASALNLFA